MRRNVLRFPDDFVFECNSEDLADLRSQFATTNPTTTWNFKRRTMPLVFTESGVAMLSSVLHSERAIVINITIMRTFIKLRGFVSKDKHEEKINKLFKVVFERLDQIEEEVYPKLSPNRRRIGLKGK